MVHSQSSITPEAQGASPPSPRLMTAALSGLLALQGVGCDDPRPKQPEDHEHDQAEADAGTPVDSGEPMQDASAAGAVTTSEVEGNRTYASLKAECDKRGGYTQIHAACAATNSCKGFSYGDWDPGVLSEHTCAGANGCNGISCVVLPEDSGRSGEEVFREELPPQGPAGCTTCHTVTNDDGTDAGKFKLYVAPGSTRTADNWLDMPAETQALTIAFGKVGTTETGLAYSNMRGYHKLLSRAEIERVVEYIRNQLTVEIHEYRLTDPSSP